MVPLSVLDELLRHRPRLVHVGALNVVLTPICLAKHARYEHIERAQSAIAADGGFGQLSLRLALFDKKPAWGNIRLQALPITVGSGGGGGGAGQRAAGAWSSGRQHTVYVVEAWKPRWWRWRRCCGPSHHWHWQRSQARKTACRWRTASTSSTCEDALTHGSETPGWSTTQHRVAHHAPVTPRPLSQRPASASGMHAHADASAQRPWCMHACMHEAVGPSFGSLPKHSACRL